MQGTEFTMAGLKIAPPSRNQVVDVIFMIVRCGAVENYMFHRDSQLVQGLDCNMGK